MHNDKYMSVKPKIIPNVLLLGNGINRAYEASSWDDIISSLSKGEYDSKSKWAREIQKLPNSLQTIVISNDSVHDGMKQVSKKLMPNPIENEQRIMLKDLLNIGFDAVLTTNYSYEIEIALLPEFNLKQGTSSKYRKKTMTGTKPQEQFGIFKYFDVNGHNIWHIHGEAARPSSMVLGHYYYGKLLSEIQNRVPNFIRTYKAAYTKGTDITIKSWIDYFLLGNIYIVGSRLDPSEMDLWWLINCKKRNFKNGGNIYLYEPNMEDNKHIALRSLAETFDIKYSKVHIKKGEYEKYYSSVIESIKL
ncbi:MAG: SIR2 family protein [Lachnospiraceae bacterium]|nr:SIR2 family protein [Lachnospiraceae bacterium]